MSGLRQVFITALNEYEDRQEWFWLAGLAREVAPILSSQLDRLSPMARQAVEHYLKGVIQNR